MSIIAIDFSKPNVRLARAFSRLTGIELQRLLAVSPPFDQTGPKAGGRR